MSNLEATLETVLALIKKTAHLQEGIEQTHDEQSKNDLQSERNKYLNELKEAVAKIPTLPVSAPSEKRESGANDEPGYPTV